MSDFESGSRKGGGKTKQRGFLDGLRSFGSDFADAFSRNMRSGSGPAPIQRSSKPGLDRRDPVAVHERPIAARMVQRRLKIERKAADAEGASKPEAGAQPSDERPTDESATAFDGEMAQENGSDGAASESAQVSTKEATDQDASAASVSGAAEPEHKAQTGGDEEASSDDANPSVSVAAKLKGVHRKVFLSPAPTPAAPAEPEGEVKPLESAPVAFQAKTGPEGEPEPHEMSVKDGKLMIASDEAPARVQVNTGAFANKLKPDQVATLNTLIGQVDTKIGEWKTIKDTQPSSRARGVALNAKYQEIEEVKRSITPILVTAEVVFELPQVGTHGQMTAAAKVQPDGRTQESHHIPGFELGNVMKAELLETKEQLADWKGLDPDDRKFVDSSAAMLTNKAASMDDILGGNRGEGLPAIAIHPNTHREGGSGAHNVDLEPKASALLKQGEEKFETTVIKILSDKKLDMNPKNPGWREQLKAVCDSQDADKAERGETVANVPSGARDQAPPNERWVADLFAEIEGVEHVVETDIKSSLAESINTTYWESYLNAWTTESAKVGAALINSKVDGGEERLGKIGELRGLANSVWRRLTSVSAT